MTTTMANTDTGGGLRIPPPSTRWVNLRPALDHHVDVKLSRDLSERLDRAALRAGISRSALCRAIFSSVLDEAPPSEIPVAASGFVG